MTQLRIMYWKEIPVQIQAEDEFGPISKQLDHRFQEGVDAISMLDGSTGTDDYLMSWTWGEYEEVEGNAKNAAESVSNRYNTLFPKDFVKRIRDAHKSGNRNTNPGAIDHWMEEK